MLSKLRYGCKLHRLIITDGTHSLSSPSNLSLLFSKTFNISIPLQHIPLDKYEFQPTNPDDLDDEDGDSDSDSESGALNGLGGLSGLSGLGGLNGHGQVEEVGRWKIKESGGLVGEGGKGVKFTVIGYVVPFFHVYNGTADVPSCC